MTPLKKSPRKPRVFIALASDILGGPGKGLVQFMNNGGREGCDPLLVAYNHHNAEADTEYIAAMRATGAPVAVLRQRRAFDYALVGQALELIRRHRITLLESNGYKSHALCWLLRRKTGLPWIAVVHGWTAENLKVRCYNALEQALLPLADQVVAVSESLKQRILPGARAKCLVIPNAVDPEEMANTTPTVTPGDETRSVRDELHIPEDAVVAGIVGRLSPEKGHSVFLRALAGARERHPALCGLVVGDGQEREHLEAEARALGLAPYCLFAGYATEMAPYYRAMDMLVMPSFSEGMPYAALEGMHMGLPLVASRVGGIPEVLKEGLTGLLLPPGDEKALAAAMLALARRPDVCRSMGEAGRERALAEFSAKSRADKILRLYESMSAPGTNPGVTPEEAFL